MPPIPADSAASAPIVVTDIASGAPEGGDFIDRAQQMVAFLAQCPHGTAQRADKDLAEWISTWRRMRSGFDATQHFVAEELGIIVRALNGPADGPRLRDQRTDHLCWHIARCMSAKT